MIHLEGIRRGAQVPMMDLQGSNARVNPLSQMDLHMLQNGYLGRSYSALELGAVPQAQASSQFHLSDSAMLVGTVAALQEESGQLRCQWKSDVSRLECELAQLRSAAAWALPQLTGAPKQPDFCTEAGLQALRTPGHCGNVGPLQQSLMLQGSVMERSERSLPLMKGLVLPEACSSTAVPITARTEASQMPMTARTDYTEVTQVSQLTCGGDREQLLSRIAELERQRNCMEIQRDQALQMQSPPAVERSPAVMPMIPERNSNMQPHEHSAMQLTEALLFQMRASCAPENHDSLQLSRSSTVFAEEPPPTVSRNLDVLTGSMLGPAACSSRVPQEESPFSATLGLAAAPAPVRTPVHVERMESELSEAQQIYQELERMEMELRKVKTESISLKEDKEACEAAHKRDVTTLEDMLSQMMEENKRLNKALADVGTLPSSSEKKVNPVGSDDNTILYSKKVEDPLTPHSIRSVSEPNGEPDALSPKIERAINFDRLSHNYNIACGAR